MTERTCARCGAPLRPEARFCGRCGGAVDHAPVEARPSADARIAAVQEPLAALVAALRADGLRSPALDGLDALARDGDATRPVVVLGEKGRGRAAIAGRLPEELAVVVLPSIDDVAALDAEVLPAVMAADVAVVVLSTTQLLTAAERVVLLDRVFPALAGPVALVVTRADAADDPEDAAELVRRVDRFVARVGRPVPTFRLAGAPGEADVAELAAWLRATVDAARADSARAWRAKVRLLLDLVDPPRSLPGEDAQGEDAPGDGAPGPREAALTTLHAEASLAREEARAVLAAGLARMRVEIAERAASATPATLQVEVGPRLEADVRRIGADAARAWLTALEAALLGRADPALGAAAARLTEVHGEGDGRVGEAPRAPKVATKRPRDGVAAVLAGAGVLSIAMVGGPVGVSAGAAMLLGAWKARSDAAARFAKAGGAEVREALDAWLAETEAALVEGFDAFTAETEAALAARVEALTPEAAAPLGAERAAAIAGVRAAVQEEA